MASHFRVSSHELYDKLGMRKKKYKIQLSEHETQNSLCSGQSGFGSSFYMVEPKTFRTKSAEFVKRTEKTSVNFCKQTPRPEFLTHAQPVHENRFVPFNDNPSMSSRHHTINPPRFDKYISRKAEKVSISLREKDLNYGPIEKNSKKGLIAFEKTTGRRYKSSESYYEDKSLKVGYSILYPNVGVFDMAKSSSRRPETKLPVFMVNCVNRGKNISFKTLKMNGYMTCDFKPLDSSFGEGVIDKTGFPIPIKGRCPKIVKVLKEKLKMT